LKQLLQSSLGFADLIGRGGTVLIFPVLFFQDDVYLLFPYLTPQNVALALTQLKRIEAPLLRLKI
jgi:hypothetical protein